MNIEALFVLCTLIVMLIVLATDRMRPGLTLLLVAIIMMLTGIITPSEMVAGFSNKGMITVAILFLVSEGVRRSGALDYIIKSILPQKKTSVARTQLRMLPAVGAISAFLNNTAVVVIFAPIVKKWAQYVGMPMKKFLIPLSYATVLGGTCSLIGTSTNLVVYGMMQQNGYDMKMFELSKVGIIILAVGLIYMLLASKRLLPNEDKKKSSAASEAGHKEFFFELALTENSPFIGEKIDNGHVSLLAQNLISGIRRNNEYIDTGDKVIEIEREDILIIAGRTAHIEHLTKIEGARLLSLTKADPDFLKNADNVVEVVLAPRFPGLRQTLKEFDFFRRYGAIIIAINKGGKTITSGFEDVKFEEGDDLILLTNDTFRKAWGESTVFHLMSDVGDFEAPQKKSRKWMAFAILIIMVVGASFGEYMQKISGLKLDMFFFAAAALFAMTALKLYPAKKYTKFISWDILIAIASAFAIASAMTNSGIADIIATNIISAVKGLGPVAVIAALFLITCVCTEFITNNAAAALTFPIALSLAKEMGLDPMPFFITICVAASTGYAVPIGYQTNLIVQSMGGYRFKDFVRFGLPLDILIFITTVTFVSLIWGFKPA